MKEIISLFELGINTLFQTSKVLGSCIIASPIIGIIILIKYITTKRTKY